LKKKKLGNERAGISLNQKMRAETLGKGGKAVVRREKDSAALAARRAAPPVTAQVAVIGKVLR
jgi:hypothetical protein